MNDAPHMQGLDHQLDLWEDETQNARLALVGPLGCGKTLALCIKALMLARANGPGVDGLLIVPTIPMARRIHLREWAPIVQSMNCGTTLVWRPSEWSWDWYHDGCFMSKLFLSSAERPDRLAGPNLGYVLYDEPGQMVREAWERGSVRARKPNAALRQVVLGGTPEGINWFAELFSAPDESHGYRTIYARGWHPDLVATGYLEQLEDVYGYDDALFRAYCKGEFVPLRQGRCYKPFAREYHVVKGLAPDKGVRVTLCCDFNVDALRWEVAQFTNERIDVFDEISLGRGGTTERACRVFKERWGKFGFRELTVTGDASGEARSTSGKTDYQIIREELGTFAPIFRLRIPNQNPRQKDRVDNVNYHLAGRGLRVSVSDKCKELIMDLEQNAWKEGAESPTIEKADPLRTHAADAWTMGVWTLARVKPLMTAGRRKVRGERERTEHAAFSTW